MEKQAVRKVKELQSDARRVLERLLQQRLAGEDRVAIILLPATCASAEAAGARAWDRLERTLDRMAERAKGASDREVEAAIEEALTQVRPRKR